MSDAAYIVRFWAWIAALYLTLVVALGFIAKAVF